MPLVLPFLPSADRPVCTEKLVMPGDNVEMVGELVHDIALEAGSRFTLREGGKTIGTGIISEVYEK